MKKINYSTELANAIRHLLTTEKYVFNFDDDGFFNFSMRIDGNINTIHYFIYIHEKGYTVYAVSPINADKNDNRIMATMADFICRANYGLRNGNFELDMQDGEIRYKCFVDCQNTIPNAEIIKTSIFCPAAMFERYGKGFVEIMFGHISALKAIKKCEEDLSESDFDIDPDIDSESIDNSAEEQPNDCPDAKNADGMFERLFSKFGIPVDNQSNDDDDTTDT